MVRVTSVLARVPVIKFRKGGAGLVTRGTPSGQGSSQAADTGSSAATEPTQSIKGKQEGPVTMGVIKVPRGVLIDCGNKKKDVVSLNIVLQKCSPKK